MLYNIIGDIHGRDCWKDLIEKDAVNIFLGDYFSPYNKEYDFVHCANNFQEIVDFAKERPETILLVGNHDEDYWHWRDMMHASRFDKENADKIHALFEENKDLFRIAYNIKDKCLVTHAGVSILWYNNAFSNTENKNRSYVDDISSFDNLTTDEVLNMNDICFQENQIYFFKNRWNIYRDGKFVELEYRPKEVAVNLNMLWLAKPKLFHWKYGANNHDYCGNSETQSPLWIRPQELIQANIFKGTTVMQIVGHTQFNEPTAEQGIIFADTLEVMHESVGIEV